MPSATAVIGMPRLLRLLAAACFGVIRPAVWPPSEKSTIAAGGRYASLLALHRLRHRHRARDCLGERGSLRPGLRVRDAVPHQRQVVGRRDGDRRVVGERDRATSGSRFGSVST